jgi:phospholipase/lecithinase/hemolysin
MRRAALACATAAAALVAGCGGSTQVELLKAKRLYVFGDELSLLTSTGQRYGINSSAATNCGSYPIWTQAVATALGLTFAECNPDSKTVTAFFKAAEGARVADVVTQVDSVIDSLGDGDVATLLVGGWDVRDLYANSGSTSDADARGQVVANQVSRLVNKGVRVLIVTGLPLEKSPWGLALDAAGRSRVVALSEALIGGLRAKISLFDGRQVGMVIGDDTVTTLIDNTSYYGLTNTTGAACLGTAVLPACTVDTLVTDATSSGSYLNNYLWADATRPAPVVQTQWGTSAVNRLQLF